MTTKEQLAEWIEAGIARPDIKEERWTYISKSKKLGEINACALGCALVGKYGDPLKALKLYEKGFRIKGKSDSAIFAALLKIPLELVLTISRSHFLLSATKIAKRLRSGKL